MCSNMSMNLAHKIAMNPTPSQERPLREHVGYARFAANSAIADFRDGLTAGEWRNNKRLYPRWNARKAPGRSVGRLSETERGEKRHT